MFRPVACDGFADPVHAKGYLNPSYTTGLNMAKARAIVKRRRAVQNIRKITRTMEMVATSKMKRAHDRVVAARPYATALRDVISGLYTPELAERFPLLRQPAGKAKRAAVLMMTGNRGLAGAFNANLIKEARNLISRLEAEGTEVELHAVGKKGLGYVRYVGRPIASSRIDIGDRPTAREAGELVDALMQRFVSRELDAVYVVYARFASALSTPPTSERVLPVTPPERGKGAAPDYLLYPSAEAILDELLRSMDRDEAEAVLGHEVAHVANGDMVTLTLIQGVVNTFVIFLSRIVGFIVDKMIFRTERGVGPGFFIASLVAQIVLGILASMIVAWFSRQREFRADAGSAGLLGSPQPMIAALARLGGIQTGGLPDQVKAFLDFWRRYAKNRAAVGGLVVLLLIVAHLISDRVPFLADLLEGLRPDAEVFAGSVDVGSIDTERARALWLMGDAESAREVLAGSLSSLSPSTPSVDRSPPCCTSTSSSVPR